MNRRAHSPQIQACNMMATRGQLHSRSKENARQLHSSFTNAEMVVLNNLPLLLRGTGPIRMPATSQRPSSKGFHAPPTRPQKWSLEHITAILPPTTRDHPSIAGKCFGKPPLLALTSNHSRICSHLRNSDHNSKTGSLEILHLHRSNFYIRRRAYIKGCMCRCNLRYHQCH